MICLKLYGVLAVAPKRIVGTNNKIKRQN